MQKKNFSLQLHACLSLCVLFVQAVKGVYFKAAIKQLCKSQWLPSPKFSCLILHLFAFFAQAFKMWCVAPNCKRKPKDCKNNPNHYVLHLTLCLFALKVLTLVRYTAALNTKCQFILQLEDALLTPGDCGLKRCTPFTLALAICTSLHSVLFYYFFMWLTVSDIVSFPFIWFCCSLNSFCFSVSAFCSVHVKQFVTMFWKIRFIYHYYCLGWYYVPLYLK